MAQIQSKLITFALKKYDGYVVVGNDGLLPTKTINEKSTLNTLDLSKSLFADITGISVNWPSLRFSPSHIQEELTNNGYQLSVFYSVYLEDIVSIKDNRYKWVKISELNNEDKDYQSIIECGKKRYV